MLRTQLCRWWLPMILLCLVARPASAQSFRIQCPTATVLHPNSPLVAGQEDPYTGPTALAVSKSPDGTHAFSPALTYISNGGAIKCQQISGGDGYMTEADGNQTFMFSFGPLSGLGAIANGQPGTLFPAQFNQPYCAGPTYVNGQPNPNYGTAACNAGTSADGAIGYVAPTASNPSPGIDAAAIMNTGVLNGNIPAPLMAFDEDDEFFLTLTNVGMIMRPDLFEQHTVHFHGYPNASAFYDGVPDASLAINIGGSFTYYYLAPDAGTYFWHCHITPPEHLQMGMVGQLFVRPRQNRVKVGNLLYAALANNGPVGGTLPVGQQSDLRTACPSTGPTPVPVNVSSTFPNGATPDILCSTPLPAPNTVIQGVDASSIPFKYAYNDGDGSTRYDIDVPIQIHGFDPNFHFVGMTFNPEGFSDMKDKYFLLNGRSYPDTVGVPGYTPSGSTIFSPATNPDPKSLSITTAASDTFSRPSQPMPTLITLHNTGGPNRTGQRALLRIADLDVTEYQTLASIGIPMQLIGFNAKLLRDQAGNNMYQFTNSITLGGGESLDVILDSTGVPAGTYFLYTTNLDHLSNDAENFGGLMSEIVVVP
jgi:FtsP/CotA-like multicopper oxidase with cupredoxin domain